jgi:hypothetical protein
MKIVRVGRNELVILGSFKKSRKILKKLREIFKRQKYKVRPYEKSKSNLKRFDFKRSDKLKATRQISPGKKKKGRLHFSIIRQKRGSIYMEVHKDRYINGHFETHHKNSQAKREAKRMLNIIAKELNIKKSNIITITKSDLEGYIKE